MSLIAELQRRSVFKVGAAYLVVGWLVIQVAATVAPQMALPDWAPRLITLVVLLGFPIALVLAWTFDLTPEGVKVDAGGVGTKRLFTIAAVLAALAIGWFMRGFGASAPTDAAAPATAAAYLAPLGEQSTAVLPFVNMSSDKENEYFSDGLTETLLHKLAQVSELKVAARTSSFAFKGKQDDIRAIGRALGVATVVEGSVQRAGDTLRITAQLVKTADGSHIWSRNYDRKLADIFAIQDEIAAAVAEALVGALLPEAKAALTQGGTKDLQAYDLYTKALQQNAISSFESLANAERLLQEALAKDPEYVDAMLALGMVWSGMSGTGMFGPVELERRMAPLLDRIEALDAADGLLLGLRAEQARRRGDAIQARALFARAIAAAPGNAELHSMDSVDIGRYILDLPVALAAIERAIALDPLNAEYHVNRAFNLRGQRRFDEAEQAARRAITIDPKVPTAYTLVADIALSRGDLGRALVGYLQAYRVDPLDHEITAEIALYLQDLGETAAAEAWIAETERLSPGTLWAGTARTSAAYSRGEKARAIDLALALVGRHAEARRTNWSDAIGAACYAAHELGRLPELRAALVKAGALPVEYTRAGFEAITRPPTTLEAQVGRITRIAACHFAPGAAGAARRQELAAFATEVRGAGWEQKQNGEFLAAILNDERERIVATLIKYDAPPAGTPRAFRDHARVLAAWSYFGIAADPRIVARTAELRQALADQRAALPKHLAAEGLSMLPPAR